MKKYKYLNIITGLFCACLMISNILDTKIFQFGPFSLPVGIIIFPITFLFNDVLTEVYGYEHTRPVIWTGFFCLALLVGSLWIAEALPPAGFWQHQEAFNAILGKLPRIAAASVSAYFISENINSIVLAKMKIWMRGDKMWLRFFASTFIGQFFDTIAFSHIAFLFILPYGELWSLIVVAWLFKVALEGVGLVIPVTIPLVKWLKKREQEDYYDTTTSFNPFKIGFGNEQTTR